MQGLPPSNPTFWSTVCVGVTSHSLSLLPRQQNMYQIHRLVPVLLKLVI